LLPFKKHRGSAAFLSQSCTAFWSKPAGAWAGLGELLARVVIPRFQETAKQNRHAARFFSNAEFFCTSGG
jgi:hypothetical protein